MEERLAHVEDALHGAVKDGAVIDLEPDERLDAPELEERLLIGTDLLDVHRVEPSIHKGLHLLQVRLGIRAAGQRLRHHVLGDEAAGLAQSGRPATTAVREVAIAGELLTSLVS